MDTTILLSIIVKRKINLGLFIDAVNNSTKHRQCYPYSLYQHFLADTSNIYDLMDSMITEFEYNFLCCYLSVHNFIDDCCCSVR